MIERLKKRMKQEKGFTLVELLAVIAILGIILAIAVPTVGNVIDNSKDDVADANAELFENAARLADLDEEIGGKKSYSLSTLKENGYLEEIPENPNSDSNSKYSGDLKVTKQSDSFEFEGTGESGNKGENDQDGEGNENENENGSGSGN